MKGLVLILAFAVTAIANASGPTTVSRRGAGTTDGASSNPTSGGGESGSQQSASGVAERDPAAEDHLGEVVHLLGKLNCDLGSSNTGEPCALQFSEAGTGKIYQLTATAKAMELYFEGARDVALEAKKVGIQTLEVVSVKKRDMQKVGPETPAPAATEAAASSSPSDSDHRPDH